MFVWSVSICICWLVRGGRGCSVTCGVGEERRKGKRKGSRTWYSGCGWFRLGLTVIRRLAGLGSGVFLPSKLHFIYFLRLRRDKIMIPSTSSPLRHPMLVTCFALRYIPRPAWSDSDICLRAFFGSMNGLILRPWKVTYIGMAMTICS